MIKLKKIQLLAGLLLIVFTACQEQTNPKQATVAYKKMSGITMGVVAYNLTFQDPENKISKSAIDSLLAALNKGSSTYETTSTITKFNNSTAGITVENNGFDQHFIENLLVAKEVVEKSDGYFDPTVAPLVNYYGFGNKGKKGVTKIDTMAIEEIMQAVGFNNINIIKKENIYTVEKVNARTQLDFSAIAKGYAIDEVGHFLEKKGIQNYLVEIGGETRASGKSPRGSDWRIIIQDPKAPRGFRIGVATISNLSMATSGNYENFRVINGEKMGHTMNPKTGFPEVNNLASATVFAKDCIIADSYATAFMAMGMEKAFALATQLSEIEAYLLYIDEQGKMNAKATEGAKSRVTE